jgi:hypothetical protein
MPPNPKTGSSANAGEGKTPTPRKSVWNHQAHMVLLMELFNILTKESKIPISQYKDQLERAMKANGMSFSFDAIRYVALSLRSSVSLLCSVLLCSFFFCCAVGYFLPPFCRRRESGKCHDSSAPLLSSI